MQIGRRSILQLAQVPPPAHVAPVGVRPCVPYGAHDRADSLSAGRAESTSRELSRTAFLLLAVFFSALVLIPFLLFSPLARALAL
jgi:hypothetical protein